MLHVSNVASYICKTRLVIY